jgi:hypothetical protein
LSGPALPETGCLEVNGSSRTSKSADEPGRKTFFSLTSALMMFNRSKNLFFSYFGSDDVQPFEKSFKKIKKTGLLQKFEKIIFDRSY